MFCLWVLPGCSIDLGKDDLDEKKVDKKEWDGDKCDEVEDTFEDLAEDCADGGDDACDELEDLE